MQSDQQTQTKTNAAIHTHTPFNIHTSIHITCKLAAVLGFWLLAIQHQAFLHFSRLRQHSWGEPEERRFPNIWWITFQEEKNSFKQLRCLSKLWVYVCPGVLF